MNTQKYTEPIENNANPQTKVENPLGKESESTSGQASFDCQDDYYGSISVASTERYVGQIPFEALEELVRDLCLQVFADRKYGGLRIDHVQGGASNRVVGITVLPSKFIKNAGFDVVKEEQAYVVRIQRYLPAYDEMEYDIAALQFATEYVKLPIPELYDVDISSDNPLDRPYSIQTRLPGLNAQSVFNDLNLEQRKSFLQQVMNVHTKIRAITKSCAGNINNATIADYSNMTRFEIPPITHNPSVLSRTPATSPQTTHDWITETCSRWSTFLKEDALKTETVWARFSKIAGHLRELGFLPDTDMFHLCHRDLLPRNLLIDICDEDTVEITGVLDWDAEYVGFCPKFVAYRAPSWMWIPNHRQACNEHMARITPSDPLCAAVKNSFDSTAGEEWLRYAYTPEYMIARRMFKILLSGACLPIQFEKAYRIIRDWNILHPEVKVPNMELTPEISQGESESSENYENDNREGDDS